MLPSPFRGISCLAGSCLVAAILLLPEVAWACPACAGRDGGGTAYLVALGSMILFPFFLVGLAGYVIRKAPTDL